MGQVVDTLTAQEFMREAMAKISLEDLGSIERDVSAKSERFKHTFGTERLSLVGEDELLSTLVQVFAVKRRAKKLLNLQGLGPIKDNIGELLYGQASVDVRFEEFCANLTDLEANLRYDLASELLHLCLPDDYWLWTRWMWDPEIETGALRLVTMNEVDLHGQTLGDTYMKVGEAIAFTNATGEAAGFTKFGQGKFGLDVFLACVYGVYTYTILRMRMTQEFNKVVPQLPELARRLLGVWQGKSSRAEGNPAF